MSAEVEDPDQNLWMPVLTDSGLAARIRTASWFALLISPTLDLDNNQLRN